MKIFHRSTIRLNVPVQASWPWPKAIVTYFFIFPYNSQSYPLFYLYRTEKPRCPVDGEDIDPATVFADICCQRELLSLSSLCPFKERGCSWKGELRDIQV